MSDSSLRFLDYLLNILPNSWCYLKNLDAFPNANTIFRFTCLNDTTYQKRMEKYKLGHIDLDIDYDNLENKKIIPPKWNKKQISEFTSKISDESIKFIILPLLLIKKDSICGKKIDYKKHMVYLILNKVRSSIEIWDDCYGYTHTHFEITDLINNSVDDMLVPILATFGYDNEAYSLFPKFLEEKYKTLHKILIDAGYPADYGYIYKLFLVNYIKYRIKHPKEKLTISVKKSLQTKPHILLDVF
jgi:hypothetical protein